MIFNKIKHSRLIFLLLTVIVILIFHQFFSEEEVGSYNDINDLGSKIEYFLSITLAG